ncbi:hypothetical protein SUDANB1_07571 [Streptomyces sp. enrichment culture]
MVCVGSRLGMVGMPNQTLYSAAKGGLVVPTGMQDRDLQRPGHMPLRHLRAGVANRPPQGPRGWSAATGRLKGGSRG